MIPTLSPCSYLSVQHDKARQVVCRMFACVSSAPNAHHWRNPFDFSPRNFGSQDALLILQKCLSFKQIKQTHAMIIRNGLCHDQMVVRKLIQLCSSYGQLDYATLVFHQVEYPDTYTWNLMIRTYALNGRSRQAILFYNLMICGGFRPDKFTFPFVVKACIALSLVDKGREVHGFALKSGFFRDMFVQNTLMDLYFKCGDMDCGCSFFEKMVVPTVVSWTTMINGLISCGDLGAARETFQRMPNKNVVAWTAMINGYVKHGQPLESFKLFREMQIDNVKPNEYTLVSLLGGCTELGSLQLGRWIHEYALKNGFKLGVFLGTALIDMYSKCGSLEDARKVFEEMEIKGLATWNSMITSLGVHGFEEEALLLFAEMEKANVVPDAITFVGVLCACVHKNDLGMAYRLLRYMTDRYGITPIKEHYDCLIELYRHAKESDEIYGLQNTMLTEPNNDILTKLLLGRDIQDAPNTDISLCLPSCECLQDSNTSRLYQQISSSKWDAG